MIIPLLIAAPVVGNYVMLLATVMLNAFAQTRGGGTN